MKELYNDFGFIILFFAMIYLMESALGVETTNKLLGVILLGMLVLNAKKLKKVTKLISNIMEDASKDGE